MGGSIGIGYDRSYFDVGAYFVCLDEMVKYGQIWFDARKLFWTKGGNSFCRQIFFQAVLTLFSTVLADMRGTF